MIRRFGSNSTVATANTPNSEITSCWHCGNPVPASLINSESETQFCCNGCQTAYQLIHDMKMEDYYRWRDGNRLPLPESAIGGETDFTEFDAEEFQKLHVKEVGAQLSHVTFFVEALHCRACVWLLEKLPQFESGVIESRVNLGKGTLDVIWNREKVQLSKIGQKLAQLGYIPQPYRAGEQEQRHRIEQRKRLSQIAFAAFLTGNTMLIAVAIYAGWFSGMEATVLTLFNWTSAVLGLASMLGPGRVFFVTAWKSMLARTPNMDQPIALGLGFGTIVGVINTIRGVGEIYFDSLTMLVFLLLVGRWLQFNQQKRAHDVLQLLHQIVPNKAKRIESGVSKSVPIEALRVGDEIEIVAGAAVPADCVIIEGTSQVDRALVTGESQPVSMSIGESLAAGMINISARLIARVEAVGEESRIGRIIQQIEAATLRKTPLTQFADRIAARFVVAVIVLAIGTFLFWTLRSSPTALDHAIALVVVACPCALGLATPLALAISIARGARLGFLIKGNDTLERLATPGTLWLDKTGTLTFGKLSVVDEWGDRGILSSVAAIEKQSTHPVAKAIVAYADRQNPNTASSLLAEKVTQSVRGGIRGEVEGRSISVGSATYLDSIGVVFDRDIQSWKEFCFQQGKSPVFCAVEGKIVYAVALGDQLRPDAKPAIRNLEALGWKIGILSGDEQSIVSSVANELGIPSERAIGRLSPEEKLHYIEQTSGNVVMVGDGLNDSAALSAADVGISVKGGAELSLASADIHVAHEGVFRIVELMGAAKRTLSTIRRSFRVSLTYNIIAVSLAAAGLINPLIAALLMPISSLTVLYVCWSGKSFESRSNRLASSVSKEKFTAQPAVD